MKFVFLLLTGLLSVLLVQGQEMVKVDQEEGPERPEILKNLKVDQDVRLDKMLNWHIAKNNKLDGMKGFRVEIFFSSDLDALERAKEKKVEFLSKYPDYLVHIKYDAPNFRVRIGDFRTKNEALKLHKEIEKSYPMAFIVPDKINFPLLKQE